MHPSLSKTYGYLMVTLLGGLLHFAASALAQSPAPAKATFPEQVRAFLDSGWMELSVVWLECSDDGRLPAIAVRLQRETPAAPVYCTLPMEKTGDGAKKVPMNEKDLQALYAAIISGAKTAFAHQYPLEIYRSLPEKEARARVQSGALKLDAPAVEMLIVHGRNAAGVVRLEEFGPCSPLDKTLQTLFHAELKEMKPEDRKAILGIDPDEGF